MTPKGQHRRRSGGTERDVDRSLRARRVAKPVADRFLGQPPGQVETFEHELGRGCGVRRGLGASESESIHDLAEALDPAKC